MKKTIYLIALIIGIMTQATTITSNAAEVTPAETIFSMINEVREDNGLSTLTWDNEIKEASSIRASEASVVWSHTRPDGTDWWTVNEKIYGENLARTTGNIKEVVSMWMDSPSHKANLLCPDYSAGCIGTYSCPETGEIFIALELE